MEKEKEEVMPPVSKFRRMLPQILAVTVKNTLVLNFGLSIGFPTVIIPVLSQPDAEIKMTLDQISWLGSLYFIIIPFGCLASGPLTQRFGRKTVMLGLCWPIAAAWVLFAMSSTTHMVFIALALHGFIDGLMESPILTYVGEVCEPSVRGPLASTTTLAALIGVSLQFLIANFLTWHQAAYLNVAFPIVSFICLLAVPESPHWLAGQDRFDDVEKSLMWLRGWVPASHVQEELSALRKSNEADKVESPTTLATYMDPSFYKPFALVVFTFFVGHFSGMSTLQTYAVQIFQSVKSPVDPYAATAAEGFIQFAGSLFCVLVLPFTGRRKLAISCALITSLLLAVLVTAGEGWPAVISLLSAVFVINTCSKVFPWVLIGEVFTPGVRAVASGMATCVGYAMAFVVNKTWLASVNVVGLRGMFILYAVVSLVGAIVYYLLLPETEGRSLDDVQAHFKGEMDLVGRRKPTKRTHGQVNATYELDA